MVNILGTSANNFGGIIYIDEHRETHFKKQAHFESQFGIWV